MTKKIFLTFDMDWASDEVLKDFYGLLCELDVCGTLNVTHSTALLDLFRKEHRLELGIHPNYNMLLDGAGNGESYEAVIRDCLKIVPEAVTVRAHSLTSGSRISSAYARYGLKYDLNMLYPPFEGNCIQCFKDVWGGVKIPFLFEDDIYLMSSDKKAVDYYLNDAFTAPRVFNFHPIHLFLNSECIERYENARPYIDNYEKLEVYRNNTQYGIRDLFVDLIRRAQGKGWTFVQVKEGQWEIETCD